MLTELRLPVALAPRPCVITLVRTWKENSALKRAALRLQACEAPTRSQSRLRLSSSLRVHPPPAHLGCAIRRLWSGRARPITSSDPKSSPSPRSGYCAFGISPVGTPLKQSTGRRPKSLISPEQQKGRAPFPAELNFSLKAAAFALDRKERSEPRGSSSAGLRRRSGHCGNQAHRRPSVNWLPRTLGGGPDGP